jgi:hypothetical protein
VLSENDDLDERLLIANDIDELQRAFALFTMSKDPADLWQAIEAANRVSAQLNMVRKSRLSPNPSKL